MALAKKLTPASNAADSCSWASASVFCTPNVMVPRQQAGEKVGGGGGCWRGGWVGTRRQRVWRSRQGWPDQRAAAGGSPPALPPPPPTPTPNTTRRRPPGRTTLGGACRPAQRPHRPARRRQRGGARAWGRTRGWGWMGGGYGRPPGRRGGAGHAWLGSWGAAGRERSAVRCSPGLALTLLAAALVRRRQPGCASSAARPPRPATDLTVRGGRRAVVPRAPVAGTVGGRGAACGGRCPSPSKFRNPLSRRR